MHHSKLAAPSDSIAEHVSIMEPAETVKDLLGEHVPLSLIMDLTEPEGPDSQQILDAEGVPEQAWWHEA